jgi:very-short-patch-repair endonuclease
LLLPFRKGGWEGFAFDFNNKNGLKMLPYNNKLKPPSGNLRNQQTDAEAALWQRIRRKQILGVQFYRQKPILNFIVDFYAPVAGLVIECDGSQHYTPEGVEADRAH